jgi:hypothetical protein
MRGPEAKREKRERALVRQEIREDRTPQQQVAVLDRKLGKGKGAKKERERLAKQIKEATAQETK